MDTNTSKHVFFEEQSGLYWIADLSLLINKTYEEQLRFIQDCLNEAEAYRSPEWGEWHMAKHEEYKALKANTDYEDIYNSQSFKPSKIISKGDPKEYICYHYKGRINEKNKDDLEIYPNHHIAPWFLIEVMDGRINLVTGEFEQTAASIDERSDELGAWVVAEKL